jgi:hypothetical protein
MFIKKDTGKSKKMTKAELAKAKRDRAKLASKKSSDKKGKMPSELLERFKSKAGGAKGKEKPDKDGKRYAGGSKTFNEKTGQHERPDGTPMKRKNERMKKRATRNGAPPKGPEATPYRGDRPKNSGTIKKVVKKSGNPYAGKGRATGSGPKSSDVRPSKPRATGSGPKASDVRPTRKKAAAKRSTQKQRVAKKRRAAKKK